jgi:hypothetical protein
MHKGRTSFCLGLAVISAVVLVVLEAGLPDRYDSLFPRLSAAPLAGIAIGGFCAYWLTEWLGSTSTGARLARVAALTLIAPLVAFPIAVLGIGFDDREILDTALWLVPRQFAVPAFITTLAWSLLHVFIIWPRLSRQSGTA